MSDIKNKVIEEVKKIFDPETGQTLRLRVSARALRTLDKLGSLSKFLRKNKSQFSL